MFTFAWQTLLKIARMSPTLQSIASPAVKNIEVDALGSVLLVAVCAVFAAAAGAAGLSTDVLSRFKKLCVVKVDGTSDAIRERI